MAKKWDCVHCGQAHGFYDCVNVVVKGELFIFCWDCFGALFAPKMESKYMDKLLAGRRGGAHGHIVFS